MVTKTEQENREQLYIFSCIIGLILIFIIMVLICLLLWRIDKIKPDCNKNYYEENNIFCYGKKESGWICNDDYSKHKVWDLSQIPNDAKIVNATFKLIKLENSK